MPTRKPKPTPKAKPTREPLPVLKRNLLRDFYYKSGTCASDLAKRCGVARNTLLSADNGAEVTPRTLIRIAAGMGFQSTEVSSLCLGDEQYTKDQLVEEACRRLGFGLWGVCDHDFARTPRLKALIGPWSGVQTQRLVTSDGDTYDLTATVEGELRLAGRAILGDFTSRITKPDSLATKTDSYSLRVEGYWFDNNHYIGLYRYDDKSMPNFGTFRLTLTFCMKHLKGEFRGWGNDTKFWVEGELQFTRLDDKAKNHP